MQGFSRRASRGASRRSLRARAAALAFWAVACAAPAHAATASVAPSPLSVTQVAPGVYLHEGLLEDWLPTNRGDVANLGFVVGSRCVAVIDTGGTPAVGEALRAAVARATPLPVCYVINTHAHPDHLLGNVAFASPPAGGKAPVFVASAKLQAALGAREPYYRNALHRDFAIDLPAGAVVYPTQRVDKQLELDLGGRVLQLDAWPTAHTDNDLTVYDRQTRTLFLSDLLFVRHMPALDGSLRGWLAVLKDVARFDVALAVPGHGPASTQWPAVLADEQRYLGTLLAQTREAIQQGLTIQQTVDKLGADPEAGKWLLADRFHRRNVTAAYAELEWE